MGEAFAYLKVIGATGECIDLVTDACSLPGMDFSTSSDAVSSYGVVAVQNDNAESVKETLKMAMYRLLERVYL